MAAERATARVRRAGQSRPSASADRRPATAESPAPVGLPDRARGGAARQVPWGVAASSPAGPSEVMTAWAPRRRASRVAGSGSREPVSSASSAAFGLIISGRAAIPRRRASPLVSRRTGTPAARAVRIRSAYAPTGTPGGRLPHRATAATGRAEDRTRVSYRPWKAAHSAVVISGPGSLNWVVSPVAASATARVRRVGPAQGTSASTTPGAWAARPARTASPAGPPAKPVAVTSWPRAASTRATLRPLPPGRSMTSDTRCEACGSSLGTR